MSSASDSSVIWYSNSTYVGVIILWKMIYTILLWYSIPCNAIIWPFNGLIRKWYIRREISICLLKRLSESGWTVSVHWLKWLPFREWAPIFCLFIKFWCFQVSRFRPYSWKYWMFSRFKNNCISYILINIDLLIIERFKSNSHELLRNSDIVKYPDIGIVHQWM